ncbi:hypothetical protein BKA70DRAFT_13601 [Coprinopsis sp. MPI-PUGE-AT-0042]|nr:hypothetical protein BKA70DRAFT_13601 [Coprinopsis sp. MPI-PUGE-AT-0042]
MNSGAQVNAAYTTLGLQEGCSFEEVKTAYKQAALRTHPDKNPGNPEATQQFQRVGEAFKVLERHLTKPAGRPGFGPFGGRYDDGDYYDDDDYDYDSDDDFYDLGELYFMFMFEQMMNSRFGGSRTKFTRSRMPEESPQAYRERLDRQRKEQIAAQARREQEAKLFKERREREREQERLDAEKRQREKQEAKKAKAESDRKKSEAAARNQQIKTQRLRSDTFAAARSGNASKVKEGVWEHSVDATGGEILPGCGAFVKNKPQDQKESLLHIAVKKGDLELVQWLTSHGADIEDRNSQGSTALHLALKVGHIPIVKYIFEEYPPEDAPAVYSSPPNNSSLLLALESGEPELVWMILDKSLATSEEINKVWSKATSQKSSSLSGSEKHSDILQLLMRYGGFTPPPTPSNKDGVSTQLETAGEIQKTATSAGKSEPSASTSKDGPTPGPPEAKKQSKNNRGGYRGRSRGKGRGRGRGGPPAGQL